ncbi:MAG: TIGR04255 family protein [Microscillaceae bacterium]|nr:TIGR04255 family protein [Microscillaceae bacterium]
MNKLPKAPLQEAIFELRWPLKPDSSGRRLIDTEYPFALGKFQDALKETFPYHIEKFPSEVPHQILNYQTTHQFWQGEKEWPVLQLGPGIATVNDTEKNYIWEKTFLPNIEKMLEALKKSYGEMVFSHLSLQYIDVVDVANYGMKSWEQFITANINFNFSNQYNTRGSLRHFHFEQAFDLEALGLMTTHFSSGVNEQKEDIFIWQTAVIKQCEVTATEVIEWAKKAHECTSSVFKEICKQEFYASFF